MTVERFLEKFELFAAAPEAIEKMRELILELAVRGELVRQETHEKSAFTLLQDLIAFKELNPLEGRRGRTKEPPTSLADQTGDLPSGWVRTTIGEVLYVIRGSSPRPKGDPRFFSEVRTKYHWVKISDIRKHGRNGLLMDTDEFLTDEGMKKSVLLPMGTLVLTNSATIGVPIVIGIDGCCIHDGYLAFPNFPHSLLSQKFLLYLFHTLKKHAEENARGLAQLNLNTDLVRSFPFGLPPLAEQKRIVAKVDELMALCDRLEAEQKEREAKHAHLARAALARFAEAPTPANLDYLFHNSYTIDPADLRKAILTQALLGRLVTEPDEYESVDARWSRLSAEHYRLNYQDGRKYRIPERIATEILPKLPPYFGWVPLEIACPTIVDSPHRTPVYSEDGTFPALRPRDVAGGELRTGQALRVGTAEYENQTQRRKPRPGDIVYSRELSFGWAVVLPETPAFCLSQGMMSARPSSEVDVTYLSLLMNSPIVRDQAEAAAIGAAHPHVNLKDIRRFAIPLPPLAEQLRIVAKVDALMALVDRLEAQLAESRAVAGRLMEAVVAELTKAEVRN